MATEFLIDLEGVTFEQYMRVNELLNAEEEPIGGLLLHTAAATPTGVRIFDLWESAAALDVFTEARLIPAVVGAGIDPQTFAPQVHEVGNVFAPGAEELARVGATLATV